MRFGSASIQTIVFTLVFLLGTTASARAAGDTGLCRYKLIRAQDRFGLLAGDLLAAEGDQDFLPEATLSYIDVQDLLIQELLRYLTARDRTKGTQVARSVTESSLADAISAQTLAPEVVREAFYSTELQEALSRLACEYEAKRITPTQLRSVPMAELQSPLLMPSNRVAVEWNHKERATEIDADVRFDSKRVRLTGPFAAIERPVQSLLDADVEVAVVVRRQIDQSVAINSENFSKFIAGFVLVTDVTNYAHIYLRNYAAPNAGFVAAKSYPTFLPAGPYFVPIEYFTNGSAGRTLLPRFLAKLRVSQFKAGTLGAYKERQSGEFSEDTLRYSLGELIQLALRARAETDENHLGESEVLLTNNRFTAGDLLLLGSLPGSAFHFEKGTKVGTLLLGGTGSRMGEAADFFRRGYAHYREGNGPLSYDSSKGVKSGDLVDRAIERWWDLKANITADEYCNNDLYLREGDEVDSWVSELGGQRHTVRATAHASYPAEIYLHGAPFDIPRPELEESKLCAFNFWNGTIRRNIIQTAGPLATSVLTAKGLRLWQPQRLRWKIAKVGTAGAAIVAIATAATILHADNAWARTVDPSMGDAAISGANIGDGLNASAYTNAWSAELMEELIATLPQRGGTNNDILRIEALVQDLQDGLPVRSTLQLYLTPEEFEAARELLP